MSDDSLAIVVGFVDRNPGSTGRRLYNAAAFCVGGEVRDRIHKMLLPTYDVFDEDRYFAPAESTHLVEHAGTKLGITICEDVWNDEEFWPQRRYHRDPVDELAEQGAELFLNISASPFTLGKQRVRRDMIRQKARKHGVPFVYVNQVGANDELVFDGHSIVVDEQGELIAALPDFEEGFAAIELSSEPSASGDVMPLDVVAPSEAELARRALVLGIRDYLRKTGFKQVVIGLSGGIDSALTAALAVEALGAENVRGIAMPSQYSSEHSLTDAKALADNLGVQYDVVPIEGIYGSYVGALADLFAGKQEGVAEENLQARARGDLLMAISNKFGSLLLTTGNKSELAVGYCTLYGDMSGGLAVISDLPKTLVYDVSRQINASAGREIIPQNTIDKPPSAELRPGQKDEDSLPPYDVLDAILERYVEKHESVDEIVAAGFDGEVVRDLVRMINRNEYKRRQAAPGIKITSKAFGMGRRYPIAASYRFTGA